MSNSTQAHMTHAFGGTQIPIQCNTWGAQDNCEPKTACSIQQFIAHKCDIVKNILSP